MQARRPQLLAALLPDPASDLHVYDLPRGEEDRWHLVMRRREAPPGYGTILPLSDHPQHRLENNEHGFHRQHRLS